jgi:hypothetical protein
MKPGDSVIDGQGRAYQVGQLLGRGAWASSWLLRRESDETFFVLKVPFAPGELRAEAPDLVYALSREAVLEQARVCEQAQAPFLARLEDRVQLGDGRQGYLVPRYATSLERRLTEGMSVAALLDVFLAVTRVSRQIEGASGVIAGVHGHLKPSNILFTERGDIVLTDVTTPASRKLLARMPSVEGTDPWLPPELEGASDAAWTPVADTWALAVALWRTLGAADGPGWAANAPRSGLDKAAQLNVKERLLERMKVEASNPRFHTRLSERLAVLLARALSREVTPSPPYRFHRVEELHNRMEEVLDLIRPRVSQIGKVLLDRAAAKPWFTTDEAIAFSCTIAVTPGVDGHEEVGVGIALFEIDRDVRVKDAELGYTVEKHPSGRYRFAFHVGALAPGRYRARVAFAIRESAETPSTADVEYQVRAAPGWVPRVETPEDATVLRIPSTPPPDADPPSVTPVVPLEAPNFGGPQAAPAREAGARDAMDPPTGPRAVVVPITPHPPAVLPVTSERTTGPRPVTVERVTGPRPFPGDRPSAPGERAVSPPPVASDVPTNPGAGPRPVPAPELAPVVVPHPPRPGEAARPEAASGPGWSAPRIAPDPVRVAPPVVVAPPRPAEPSPRAQPEPAALNFAERVEEFGVGPGVSLPGPRADDPPSRTGPVPVRRPNLVVPEPPKPAPSPLSGGWTRQSLPGQPTRDYDAEDPPTSPPEDADDLEPGPVARIADALRNDPYLAVMSGIGVMLAGLLLYFLVS